MRKLLFTLIAAMFMSLGSAQEIQFLHDNPEWQQNFEALGETSAEEIDLREVPTQFDTEVYKSRVKVDLTSPRAPGLFKWWFGYRANELTDAELLADLTDVWDEVGDNYAPGVREALTADGKPYAFPLHVSYWPWFYSKAVYEKYDLEPPQTWAELEEQLALFKEEGISGIGNTIGNSRWTAFIPFQEILYRLDKTFYNDLMEGRAHWTDPTAVRAMELWRDWLEAGYFAPQDATYVEDFPRMLQEGTLAFAPFGDWYGGILQTAGLVSGEDYGMFFPPAIEEAGEGATILEISAITVGENSEDKDLAKEWLRWYSTSEGAAQTLWATFKFAPTDNLPEGLLAEEDPARAEELAAVENYPDKLIRLWEATPVEIVEKAVDEFNAVIADPSRYEEALNAIEATAADVWPDYGVSDY